LVIPTIFVVFINSIVELFCLALTVHNESYSPDLKIIAGIVFPICWLLNIMEESDDGEDDMPEDLKEAFYGDKYSN
jgi:ABC-type uncharacterized transport system permease subunit